MNRRQALQACALLPFFDQKLVGAGDQFRWTEQAQQQYSISFSFNGTLTIRGPKRSVTVSVEEIMDALMEGKP